MGRETIERNKLKIEKVKFDGADDSFTTVRSTNDKLSDELYGYIPFVILVFKDRKIVDTIYTNCPKELIEKELKEVALSYGIGHSVCLFSESLTCNVDKVTML